MKTIPENISKVIDEFLIGLNKSLGNRLKELYFMVLMQDRNFN